MNKAQVHFHIVWNRREIRTGTFYPVGWDRVDCDDLYWYSYN